MNETPSESLQDKNSSANSSRWTVYLFVTILSGASAYFSFVLALLSFNQTVVNISIFTSIACFIIAVALVDRGRVGLACLLSLAITPIFFGVGYLYFQMRPFVMTAAQKATETRNFIVAKIKDPQPALDRALRDGSIRKATAEDVSAFKDAYIEKKYTSKNLPVPDGENALAVTSVDISRAYVVLKEFTYPSGLVNEYRAVFFIPKGVPKPSGGYGQSAIYNLNFISLDCLEESPCGKAIEYGEIRRNGSQITSIYNSGTGVTIFHLSAGEKRLPEPPKATFSTDSLPQPKASSHAIPSPSASSQVRH